MVRNYYTETTRRVRNEYDQLTNRIWRCVVNLPHHESHLAPYMGQDGEYWVLDYKNHFSLSVCMQINHYLML